MCGRYTLTSQEGLVEDVEAALDPEAPRNIWWKPRFNIAPTQDAPVVALRAGVRTLGMMRWGLVPFWAGAPGPAGKAKRPPLMINARVETLAAKPAFRDALARRRCLVPANGFFEWRHAGKLAQPMYIHPASGARVAFAGLWARARTEAGELHSFTIITGPPSGLVAPIHDRQPVVVAREAWAAWLDPASDAAAVRALLARPASDAGWIAEPVSTRVNKPDPDDPALIEPIAPPEPGEPPRQGSLF